ncbi:hypothetical protein [Paenibacillus wynnii]|uniref:Uncharacterized protein n=1 Tax=Paenibacillus wynnii TaxID=268407 RepID=A0A098M338_9BACL|nr:hypothetical protein [Paenibacillus wynnii]KGE16398.1 hypothetical protein PWYN_16780 [Paenibacillus wynnii]
MRRQELLLLRLDEIGIALEVRREALLLLGLGSVGVETHRLDEYSDLDFFLIVATGAKDKFINQLDWLEDACPLTYSFKNTKDGYKVMFEDGIYGEFAVFEESELKGISFSGGRVVWKASNYEWNTEFESTVDFPKLKAESVDYVVNEALTNIYVGLGRFARGEKLSATRFIESYPVNGILSVLHLLEPEVDCYPDKFSNERRVEQRFPEFSKRMGSLMQGYDSVPYSALELLSYLEEFYPVNERMSAEIRRLAHELI